MIQQVCFKLIQACYKHVTSMSQVDDTSNTSVIQACHKLMSQVEDTSNTSGIQACHKLMIQVDTSVIQAFHKHVTSNSQVECDVPHSISFSNWCCVCVYDHVCVCMRACVAVCVTVCVCYCMCECVCDCV